MFNPLPPIELVSGRHSVPPVRGSVRETVGSSEPGDRCTTFVRPRLPTVRPPVAAVREANPQACVFHFPWEIAIYWFLPVGDRFCR